MKNKLLLSVISIIIIGLGCEDNLNPFFEKDEIFILNSVLKNDRNSQSLFLSKSYFVDNFDPSSNTDDHSIRDAYVRIFFRDSVKIFSDTSVEQVTDGESKNITSYYHNDFFTYPDTEYELEAVLKDGRKLTAVTRTPKKVTFKFTSDPLIPPVNKSSINVEWSSLDKQLYTAARFKFIYFKNENGKSVRYEKEIPRTYALQDGEYKPFFPEPSYDSFISVDMNSFDRALREISEGDPNKENYTILAFILEILVYDRNLTAYYASKTELGEGFSITVNENDYSNINGGRGIFGSFIKQRYAIKFTLDYIHSFGYIPGLTEGQSE